MSPPQTLRHVICPLADIPDPGALGFSPPGARFPDECFLVRHAGALHAYHNVCPHAGNFLNWKPDAFLTRDKSLIMCSAHGALFNPATGLCVAGPCPGRSLQSVKIAVEDGMVVAFFSSETRA
ncbi:MAG: Rieske (2Fe-2S) protein [Gammaproteobacteria bacterium]|nr:Rieske (2Fe-2S) protein [Gammaproteobacteria bacterium]MDE2345995.1 Rieske (2Fe-2S) protein [Gammaproteobacteria bacterium]